MTKRTIQFQVGSHDRHVTGILLRPRGATALYVVGHGAGAGMRHAFFEAIASRLAAAGIATLRYQFPYMEEGRRRPDQPHLLEETVRSALEKAAAEAAGLPVIAGGKSLGGRITSMVAAKAATPSARGLIFLGYPLHAPNKPGTRRADHLPNIKIPMLFLQGTRDSLANLRLLEPILERLPNATLHVVDGADHSFKVLKRSGRTEDEVFDEMTRAIVSWCDTVGAGS